MNDVINRVDGVPFHCTNDLDIGKDGTIYFTDASSRFSLKELKADIVEHRGNGRLLAYDPVAKTTRVVLGDLCFANGVAVSPDGSFVLVVETGAYRVHRIWLNGPKQGQSEVFIDNLPGFRWHFIERPRTFWLALVPRAIKFGWHDAAPVSAQGRTSLAKFLQPAIKR